VIQQGTPVSALNLNRIEDGVQDFAHDYIGGMLVVALQEVASASECEQDPV